MRLTKKLEENTLTVNVAVREVFDITGFSDFLTIE